ncbi:MAG: hypothetical protein EPO68_02630, partial [Planctomycetota bacterium]
MPSRTRASAALLCGLWASLIAAPASLAQDASLAQAPGAIRYDRDIRPILSDRCFRCHGPDLGSREAKLRLDEFDDATAERKRGRAIAPGDPANSLLLQRVAHADPDERMPPADS